MNNKEKAKHLMEEGWKAREALDFTTAEKLLNEAKTIFESENDWYNVAECLNHLAYSEKLKAIQHNILGLKLAKEAEKITKVHNLKRAPVLRALISLASSSGLFEQALQWGNESLELAKEIAPRADILAHLALFKLRTGNILEAEEYINEAEKLITDSFESEREPHRSIWKSKIIATKGLILYNKNQYDESARYLNEALNIAESQNLKTRIEEIKLLLELVK